jgi:hypothetical protein
MQATASREASTMTEALASKTCTPCRGGIPPLTREQAELFRAQAILRWRDPAISALWPGEMREFPNWDLLRQGEALGRQLSTVTRLGHAASVNSTHRGEFEPTNRQRLYKIARVDGFCKRDQDHGGKRTNRGRKEVALFRQDVSGRDRT